MIEVRPVQSKRERSIFITFPWRIYKNDPLWIPPIVSDREKNTDPGRGLFFKGGGIADLYIAWKDGRPLGTISCGREKEDSQENMFGFFECYDDYAIAEALFRQAETWAGEHHLPTMIGTYNLDREENRGILIEGRDRPASLLCGYNPPYYAGFFERYGFGLEHDDGLAYAMDLDLNNPKLQRLSRVADRVRQRKNFTIRGAHMDDVENEIDRIWDLQNRALAHLPGFLPYPREAIETMVLPLKEMADADLVLFAEVDGKAIGWFPAIPNFNEILIKINGLRYPWDYLRALVYQHKKIESIAIKSVAVPPEYWDTGVAVLLFDEMVKRAVAKGYKWADLSMTGEDNPDTWDLAHHMGAKIYKRYRFYKKAVQ
ncbi:MAG TPA: GNAT family N-acetyltransferase [Anaerolineales bacterium]|nr:GNAT family N-acetyltransferase [Anaerolineales bacterium]